MSWVDKIHDHWERKYSQGGQDGFLKYIFGEIGTTNKFCVEFGFNSLSLIDGTGANTARLVLEDGWKSVLFDADNENPEINLHREVLTVENIGKVFEKYDVPVEPDYVSIDVDGDDLWLFGGMLLQGYRPRVASVEYNARFPLNVAATVKEGTKWEGDAVYGASMLALNMVAAEFDYRMIAVESGLDLFFARGDVLKGIRTRITDFEKYTDIHIHPVPTPERASQFVEYPSLEPLSSHPWWGF